MRKVDVAVNAVFSPSGHVASVLFLRENERRYAVDRVLDGASRRSGPGGAGLRYTGLWCGASGRICSWRIG